MHRSGGSVYGSYDRTARSDSGATGPPSSPARDLTRDDRARGHVAGAAHPAPAGGGGAEPPALVARRQPGLTPTASGEKRSGQAWGHGRAAGGGENDSVLAAVGDTIPRPRRRAAATRTDHA